MSYTLLGYKHCGRQAAAVGNKQDYSVTTHKLACTPEASKLAMILNSDFLLSRTRVFMD